MNKEELNYCLDKINKISKLEDNWDLYGACKIPKNIIDLTIDIVSKLEYMPEIFPTPCDSIQLEFDNDNGDYLEIEISNNNNIDIFRLNYDDTEEEYSYDIDIEYLNNLIKSFYN